MMLPERTSSAHVARAFQRFARGAVVGLALGVLAACGGGGSSTPAKTTPTPETPTPETPTPEMTITPSAPTAAQLEAAPIISAGETVDGTLESADDAKYYRLEISESGTYEFTLEAEAGLELAILDSAGNVIITAETESPTKILYTLKETRERLFARISNKVPAPAKKTFKFISKNLGPIQTIINLLNRDLKFELTVGGQGVTIDVNEFFSFSRDTLPEDAPRNAQLAFSLSVPFVKATYGFNGLTMRIDRGAVRRDRQPLKGHIDVCLPIVNICRSERVEVIARLGIVVKEDYRYTGGTTSLHGSPHHGLVSPPAIVVGTDDTEDAAGGLQVWRSRPLVDYFHIPENTQASQISYALGEPSLVLEGLGPGGRPILLRSIDIRGSGDGRRLEVTLPTEVFPPNDATASFISETIQVTLSTTIQGSDLEPVRLSFVISYGWDPQPRVKHVRTRTFYLGRGETKYTSKPLGEYFEYDGTSELTFSSRTTGASGTGWSPQIRGDKLEVSQSAMTLGHYVEVDVTATSPGGSATVRFEVQIGYVVCCNDIFSCSCGFQYRYYHPVCYSRNTGTHDQRVTNCPRTGLEYTGGPSTTRECCEDTDLDSTREEAGLRVQECRCENTTPSLFLCDGSSRGWRSTASCSVNRF